MEKNSKQIEDDEMPAQNIVRDKKKLLSTEVGSIVKANDNIDSKFLISPRGKDGKIVVQKNDFEVLLDRLAERDITLTKVLIPQSPFLPKVKDGVQKLANAIYNNNYITEIDLRMNKLRDAEMLILCPSFTSCSKLNNLNLEGNSIGSDGHEIIANMMENHPSLTTLKLTNQFYVTVSVEAERVLLNSLSQNTYLTKLGYAFERRDAFREREVVAQYLQRNQTAAKKNIAVHVPLEVPFPAVRNKQPVLIDILPNVVEVPETEGMSVAERKKLMASKANDLVSKNDIDGKKVILKLDKDGKVIIPENDFQKLLRQLQSNDPTITIITFRGDMKRMLSINDKSQHGNYIKLAEALKGNTRLTEIDLYGSSMCDVDMIALCPSLSTCTSLCNLNVDNNKLSTTGVIALAKVLEACKSLQIVKLEGQVGIGVGPEAEKQLVSALSQNTNITTLGFTFQDITFRNDANRILLARRSASYQPPNTIVSDSNLVSKPRTKSNAPPDHNPSATTFTTPIKSAVLVVHTPSTIANTPIVSSPVANTSPVKSAASTIYTPSTTTPTPIASTTQIKYIAPPTRTPSTTDTTPIASTTQINYTALAARTPSTIAGTQPMKTTAPSAHSAPIVSTITSADNSNNITPIMSHSTLVLKGVLLKRSDWIRSWNSRYVTLNGQILTIATEDHMRPHRQIKCTSVTVENMSNTDTLVVKGTHNKKDEVFYFRATNAEDFKHWQAYLEASVSGQ